MPIPILPGALVCQHPDERVTYTIQGVPDPSVRVRRVRPQGEGTELQTKAGTFGVVVWGGVDGARYEITVAEDITFQVRVSSLGFVRQTRDPTPEELEAARHPDPTQRKSLAHLLEVTHPIKHGEVLIRGRATPVPIVDDDAPASPPPAPGRRRT